MEAWQVMQQNAEQPVKAEYGGCFTAHTGELRKQGLGGKGRTKAAPCKWKGLLGRAQHWEYSDMGVSAVTLSALELLAASPAIAF